MNDSPAINPGPSRKYLTPRRLITWLILVVLFVLLFKMIPPAQVLLELKGMSVSRPWDLLALLGCSCVVICGITLLDGTAMWYCFSRFEPAIKWREIIKVRAAMMLLASISTLIGQAGLAVHVARKYKVPAGTAAGMVMFLFLLEIYGMIAVSTLALPVLAIFGVPPGPAFRTGVLLIAGAWPALIIFIAAGRRMRDTRLFERLRLAPLLIPLRTLTNADILRLLLFKGLLALWQVVMAVVVFRLYGLLVPSADFFFFLPLAILFSSIPITPARLGTTQFSWVFFMGQYLTKESLVAFSLLFQFLLNIARWAVGLLALPFVSREIKITGEARDET
ncbi:MAG TPA: lysylphosphatidylglycerol synthase domain-containing protein [bacterium]|nr:lysylphosphatidylglycerol synthase domain-containing protein [bacterium]